MRITRLSLRLDKSSFHSTDVDECSDRTHNCHGDAWCDNSVGSFACTCYDGYTGNGEICEGNFD